MDIRGIKAAARESLRRADQNPRKLTLLFLLCSLVLSVAYNLISYYVSGSLEPGLGGLDKLNAYNAADSLLYLVITIFVSLWSCHYQNYALRLSRGEETSFRDFTAPFRILGSVFLLYFLSSLFIGLWSMLFVIPGLVAAYRYRLAFFALFDDETISANEALNRSKFLTYGHKMELLKLDLSFFWYYLLLALPEMISLWVMWGIIVIPETLVVPVYLAQMLFTLVVQALFLPYVMTAEAHAYNWILGLQREPMSQGTPDPNAPIQLPPNGGSFGSQ